MGNVTLSEHAGASVGVGARSPLPLAERFELRRRLGSGGFGEVWEAFDRGREAVVALKRLRRRGPLAVARFKREFRQLSELTHPGLVQLYELHAGPDGWFFTMELVDGVDLKSHVRGSTASWAEESIVGPWAAKGEGAKGEAPRGEAPTPSAGLRSAATERPPAPDARADEGPQPTLPEIAPEGPRPVDEARLRSAMIGLCEGLLALHEAGKLHCDIKPSNVLVDGTGRVVLVDFGLATDMTNERARAVEGGEVWGTPGYMSPEQASGRTLTPASDWYGVGVLLHELLTGRLPISGPDEDVMARKQRPLALAESPPAGVSAELWSLCRELLELAPQRRPSGAEVLGRLRGEASGPRPVLGRTTGGSPFVGRAVQRKLLSDALSAAGPGRPVAVLLHGRSGMGKTALLDRFAREIAASSPETLVLRARCYEQESVPFKAVDGLVDALTAHLVGSLPAERGELLPDDIGSLATLFPVLREVVPPGSSGPVPDPVAGRRKAIAALRELLSALARRRPLALLVDDVQWGDVDSGALLADLLEPPLAPGVLLVASYRSEDAGPSPCLRALVPSLRAAGRAGLDVREVAVSRLSIDEAEALASTLLSRFAGPDAERAEAIAREAGGCPFFIDQLCRHAAERAGGAGWARQAWGPGRRGDEGHDEASLGQVVRERAARLPAPARRLLEVVALAGRPMRRALAAEAAGVGHDDLSSLPLLRAGRFVKTRGSGDDERLEAYHDRVREAVAAGLGEAERRALHRAIADALGRAEPDDAEPLATHLALAGDRRAAAAHAARAAAAAREALAFERAARLFTLALELGGDDLPDAVALRVGEGEALALAGRSGEAARSFRLAARSAPPSLAHDLERRAAEQLALAGSIEEASAMLERVLSAAGLALPRPGLPALVSLVVIRLLLLAQRAFGPRAFGPRAFGQARGGPGAAPRRLGGPAGSPWNHPGGLTDSQRKQLDAAWAAAAGLATVDPIRGAYFASLHLSLSLRAGERSHIARSLVLEAAFQASRGRRARSPAELGALEAASSLAHEQVDLRALALLRVQKATSAAMRGRWREAARLFDEAERALAGQAHEVAWELANVRHFSLVALAWVGDWRELALRLPEVLRDARERGNTLLEASVTTAVGHLPLLAADQPDEARERLRVALEPWRHLGFLLQHHCALLASVDIELYAGRAQAALDRVDESWASLERSQMLRVQALRVEARFARARARLAAAQVASPERRAGLLRASARDARRLEREGVEWASALGRLLSAGLSLSRGEREKAEGLLDEAAKRLEGAGMPLHASLARLRLGSLVGGERGERLGEQARAALRAQLVVSPERLARALAPGPAGEFAVVPGPSPRHNPRP